MLAEAGSIETGRMTTDVPVETVLPAATGTGNAATYYVEALNSWDARRLPYLKNRMLNPFADEPPLLPSDLTLLVMGAAQKECDFYSRKKLPEPLIFVQYPGPKPWPFEPASDPYAMRPYINILRLVAQGALNAGKKLERGGKPADAERLYQVVTRLGCHLNDNPGSILDVQLGIELEQKGLHYLDVFYRLTRNPERQRAVWRYGDSLTRHTSAVQRKFTQLGNPEAAIYVLQHDSKSVWRVQAASALALALDVDSDGWLEGRAIRHALGSARSDPNPEVRQAVQLLASRAPTPSAVPAEKVLQDAGH